MNGHTANLVVRRHCRDVHLYCKVALLCDPALGQCLCVCVLCVNMQNNLTFRFMNRSEKSFIHFVCFFATVYVPTTHQTNSPQQSFRLLLGIVCAESALWYNYITNYICRQQTIQPSNGRTNVKRGKENRKEQMRWRDKAARITAIPSPFPSFNRTGVPAAVRTARCSWNHVAIGTPNVCELHCCRICCVHLIWCRVSPDQAISRCEVDGRLAQMSDAMCRVVRSHNTFTCN